MADTVPADTDVVAAAAAAADDDDDFEMNLNDHMMNLEEEGPSLPSHYFDNDVMSTPMQRKHFESLRFHNYGYDSSVKRVMLVSYCRLAYETVVSEHYRSLDEVLMVAVAELASYTVVVVVSDTHHCASSTAAEVEEVHAEVEAEETSSCQIQHPETWVEFHRQQLERRNLLHLMEVEATASVVAAAYVVSLDLDLMGHLYIRLLPSLAAATLSINNHDITQHDLKHINCFSLLVKGSEGNLAKTGRALAFSRCRQRLSLKTIRSFTDRSLCHTSAWGHRRDIAHQACSEQSSG